MTAQVNNSALGRLMRRSERRAWAVASAKELYRMLRDE